jgi:NTE family protein
MKKVRLGLALGGGAARGLAHIGVLQALEDCKVPIGLIAGASMGAIIGAIYAMEPSAARLQQHFTEYLDAYSGESGQWN